MSYRTVYKEVEVDIDMEDFEDDDLIDEMNSRGYSVAKDMGDLLNMLNSELTEHQYRRVVDILEDCGVNEGADYRIYEAFKKLAYG